MRTLFLGIFDETSKFIFGFYNFDKVGNATAEDIWTVLSYITLSEECQLEEPFKQRVNSQSELRPIFKKWFAQTYQGKSINLI